MSVDLGSYFKKQLKVHDLTQEQAAEKLGVSRQTVNTWCKSSTLSDEVIELIWEKLDISLVTINASPDKTDTSFFREPSANYGLAGVPIYDINFSASFDTDNYSPIGYINIPEVKGCDILIRARDEAMKGKINEGDLIGVKRIEDFKDFLMPSYPYAIITKEFDCIRYIEYTKDTKKINTKPFDNSFQEFELPLDKILKLYQIRTIIPFSQIKTII